MAGAISLFLTLPPLSILFFGNVARQSSGSISVNLEGGINEAFGDFQRAKAVDRKD
jgi:hypothetical protein